MPRTARVLAGLLLPVAVVAAVSACSSSSDGGTPSASGSASNAPAPSASASDSASSSASSAGGNHGRLDYTGSASGGFDVTTSVGCATLNGKMVAVTAPDPGDSAASTAPSFVATIGAQSTATLVTADKHTFVKLGADGISAAERGGTWTVTVSGTELGAADASGGSVTVNGHLTCTKVSGT